MGLLGEYIGRIYHDVRARPRSFTDRVLGRDFAGAVDKTPRWISQNGAETVTFQKISQVLCCVLPHIQHDGRSAFEMPVEQ